MGVRLKRLLTALMLAATSTTVAIAASAQTRPGALFVPRQSIPDVMDDAFDPSSFTNFVEPIDYLIGFPNGFIENKLAKDGENIHALYRDLLQQQTTNDPYIRTPDLPTPYATSVLLLPTSVSNRITGTELIPERPPQIIPTPNIPSPQPPATNLPQRF